MFKALESINERPKPFEYYTIEELWNDEHTSKQMLKYHLNPDVDLSSRKPAFIGRSVAWIVSRFNVGAGTRIADLGCGPGLYALRLAEQRADVTGIDISENSIRYAEEAAKEAGQDIHYVNQNYLAYRTDRRFDLIIMIMCDFCVLSPEQRTVLLGNCSEMLKPGGSVLLDVYSLKAFEEREEQAIYEVDLLNGFWAADTYYGFFNTFKYEKEKVVLDKYTIVEPDRTRTVYNWLQYFSVESVQRELSANGFQIDAFYSDVAGKPFDPETPEFAVIATKS